MTVAAREGVPFYPGLHVIVEVNGNPAFLLVRDRRFDQTGTSAFTTTVPAGLSGLAIGLQTFTVDGGGRLIASAVEPITVQ